MKPTTDRAGLFVAPLPWLVVVGVGGGGSCCAWSALAKWMSEKMLNTNEVVHRRYKDIKIISCRKRVLTFSADKVVLGATMLPLYYWLSTSYLRLYALAIVGERSENVKPSVVVPAAKWRGVPIPI